MRQTLGGWGGRIVEKGVKEHFALRCLVQLYLSLDVGAETYSHSQNIGDLYMKQEKVNDYFCMFSDRHKSFYLSRSDTGQTASICRYFH